MKYIIILFLHIILYNIFTFIADIIYQKPLNLKNTLSNELNGNLNYTCLIKIQSK